MKQFNRHELKRLYRPHTASANEDNGQVTIIGGSSLFHGAPILALKVASRIVDMVFFATPESSVGKVAEQLKSQLSSFIWIPWDEVDAYIEKSDAVLIGPGMMRYHKEVKSALPTDATHQVLQAGKFKNQSLDGAGKKTREITERLLKQFPHKQWVIDAGSLQTMDVAWIPENAILTPNKKEFEMLFEANLANQPTSELVEKMAKRYNCFIVLKGETTIVCPPAGGCVGITGGNPGLTKGGTGDVQAGLTVALAAKNEPFLAASSTAWIIKKAADELYERVGIVYNADDVADEIPVIFSLQSLSKVDK